MWTVYYSPEPYGEVRIFVCAVPSFALAQRIAANLALEFPESVYRAWAEQD